MRANGNEDISVFNLFRVLVKGGVEVGVAKKEENPIHEVFIFLRIL